MSSTDDTTLGDDLLAMASDQQERPHRYDPGAVEDLRDRLAAALREAREALEDHAAAVRAARERVRQAEAESDRLAAQVEAVRKVHRPEPPSLVEPWRKSNCLGCYEAGGYDAAPLWPCPTILAMNSAE